MELKKCILTKNDCYKKGTKITTKRNSVTIYATKGSWSKISLNSEPWLSSKYLK